MADPAIPALQRVVVRMLFDPAFVARVHADPDAALAGLELPRERVAELLAHDRRLWNADRLRRTRALRVLMEEFKASTAYALLETGRLAFLDAFFSSERFHASIQARGYTALAFIDYLRDAVDSGQLRSAHVRAVLGLESAMARARRDRREAARRGASAARAGADVVAPVPGVRSVEVPGGTIAAVQAMEKHLFESALVPALSFCADAPRPAPLPEIDASKPEAYLLQAAPGGKVELHGIPLSYHRFLDACAPRATRAEVAARLARHGIRPADVRAMEESLRESGVLLPEAGEAGA